MEIWPVWQLDEGAGAPGPPQGAQVESGGQHGPLGRHVNEASQQEPPCHLLLFDDSKDRLDQLFSQPVSLFSCPGAVLRADS